jgi:molecular chaperone GrpE
MKEKKNKDRQTEDINTGNDVNNNNSEEEVKVNNETSASPESLQTYEQKINELELQLKELQDKFLRKAAEFENYKRRTENDQLNLLSYAAESFILNLLPVVDDFERSLKHIKDARDTKSIQEGVKLMYEKLLKVLKDQGVKKMDVIGKPFDVDYHDALMQKPDSSVPPHTVLEEIEPGYMYKDKVIRHAKVIVSDESTAETSQMNDQRDNNKEEGNK